MKATRFNIIPVGVALSLLLSAVAGFAQAVVVTARLDTNTISVGSSTTLRVFAQVVPGLRPTSDRIFSWYLDVLNTNAAVASANYGAMTKPASDNDPLISSMGLTQGANRRGIYDTFLNLPGAGVNAPVELMRIPVTGVATGRTLFSVAAGSGVPQLETDFFVAPLGGGDPYLGGSYTTAFADLQVTGGAACAPVMQIARLAGGTQARLTFTPCVGRTHFVEGLTAIDGVATWQVLPAAPHNSGDVVVNLTGGLRIFRVRVTTP
jgi:hypothetical protein